MHLENLGEKLTLEKQEAIAKQNMSLFLANVEKRAFRMAVLATKNEADALDLVQETMMKLVKYYLFKPEEQWKPLFYKILHNNIMDWHRHKKWQTLLFFKSDETEVEQLPHLETNNDKTPEQLLQAQEGQSVAISLLADLPIKQKQCFLLRAWEGLSVKETAKIMKCSEGSVKTHFYRASQKLKHVLEQDDDQ